ncbi:MAG: HlyD family secretion protein [Stenotrophobium sp.]
MKVRFVEPERADPNRDRGITVPYAPAKRHLARWRWYAILLVVSSPLLYFAGRLLLSSVLVEAPAVVSQDQITVRTNGQGYVDEVFVKPMEEVAAGAPLVRLSNPGLDQHLGQLRAELQALEGVKTGAHEASISTVNLEDQLDIAKQQRDQRDQHLGMVEQLYTQGAATDAELTAARADVQQAATQVAQIYQQMTMLNRSAGQVAQQQLQAQVQARVLSLRAEIAGIEKQNESLLVTAPYAGRIVDLTLVKGDQLAVGGKVAMLAPDNSALHVDAYVPPKYSKYARDGVRAVVVFPDGVQRPAEVVDVPEETLEVPSAHPEMFGTGQVGVLVRMKFTDASAGNAGLTNGLPVKVRFENRWNTGLPQETEAALRNGWTLMHSILHRWS